MKLRLILLNWFLFIYLFNLVLEAGFADSLYFEAGEPSSENGDTLYIPSDTSGGDVTIYIKARNDEPISALTVPLIDECDCAYLDPAKNNGAAFPICFQGSRVEDFSFLSLNLNLSPPQVFYGAISMTSHLPAGHGLFAKMIYTIPPEVSDICTCICLDTLFFPPHNILRFVDTLAEERLPGFEEKCFRVTVKKQTEVPEVDSKRGFYFNLKQNYPNPFNSLTTIPFTVHCKQQTENNPIHITIDVYNVLGRKVKTILDQEKSPGEYQALWNGKDQEGKDVGSGIYFCKLSSEDLILIKKMVLLR